MRFGLKQFGGARGGNVAMIWALMVAFMVGLTGLSVDFTRAQMIRAQMQNAVDGAALAGARGDIVDHDERMAAARSYFEAEMGDLADRAVLTLVEDSEGRVDASAYVDMPLSIARLIRDEDWRLSATSQAERSGVNVEVSLVLDVTGSMAGQRLLDLQSASADLVDAIARVEQEPYYSKVALVTYSTGVNVGSYADQVRGPIIPGRSLSNSPLNWLETTTRNITAISKSSSRLTVTSDGHGYATGDRIYISGVSGMTQVNNKVFIVNRVDSNRFRLHSFPGNVEVSSSGHNDYISGGSIRRCRTSGCEVTFTADNHGFSANEYIYVTGVGGMARVSSSYPHINNSNPVNVDNPTLWRVGSVLDANTFTLRDSFALNYGAWTSGGTAYCLQRGCEYFRFTNTSSRIRVLPITTCASERTGANRYSDVAPSVSYVGRNYARHNNANAMCPSSPIVPLTIDADMLQTRISAMTASGYTAGHIGLEWGWYMVAPDFGYLFPADSRPGPYGDRETLKIVVLMTDGEFNTGFCQDVTSSNSGMGGSERINCGWTNGHPNDQTAALCTAMKARGVVVYTVGFQVGSSQMTMLRNCATSSNHAYQSSNGAQLRAAFQAIAASITQLRLTR